MSTNLSWNDIASAIVNSADARGIYVDNEALEELKGYFQTGVRRIRVAAAISSNATAIIKETMARRSSFAHSFKLNHTVRQYAACIRDLDYFLRYASYAMLVGDSSILDERVLNGLAETYTALNVPIDATVEFIRTMQEVTACIVGHKDSQVIAEGFNYLCDQLTESSKAVSHISVSAKSSEDTQSWEPKNYREWLNHDKLAQQIQQNGVEDIISLEHSASSFFEALSHAPYVLRRQVWREREVMAALYQQITVWEKVPGFLSISVGRREVKGKNRLVGIINFVHGTPLELMHNKAGIPSSISVDSSIAELKESEKEIPIVLEVSDIPIYHSAPTRLDTMSSAPTATLVIQSGDKIAGRSSNGSEGSRVTLTTFVISKGSSNDSNVVLPHALTVRHGFSGYTDINTCESQVHTKIGEVVYNITNSQQQSLAEKLDIALIKLSTDQDYILKPHLRWVDEYPKKPVPILSGMPVQMFGGISEHTLGAVDESMIIYPGPNQSIVPDFSVTISSQPGDSGSLLVVGHHSKVPIPEFLEDYMSGDWANLVYSMQGVLLAGSVRTLYGSKAIFRPMITILHWLKLEPYLP